METLGINNQFNNPNFSNSNNTFNFSKYEDHQKMLETLKDLEEMLEDTPQSKSEKRLKYSTLPELALKI